MIFLILISIIWFVAFSKKLLFWVYLWQLKEYHVDRFRDHFRTFKGRQLIFNWLLAVKILILLGIFFFGRVGLVEFKPYLLYLTGFVFLLESTAAFRNFWRGSLKKPVLTRKVAVILTTGLSFMVLLLFFLFLIEINNARFTFSLLFLDALAPLALSALVLAYQPLAVVLRNRVINQAKTKRAKFKNLLVVGVTGSYGKTSTKDYLALILSEKFKVLKTREHQNSEIGIANCILDELGPEHQVFVCEMGAYNRGGIKFLCGIAQPKIGVLTGVNEQHMATFGSQENIVKTKYELIESLPEGGAAFFNANNKYCVELYNKTQIKKKLYGEGASSPQEENLAGARAVAQELGLNQEEIERAVQKIKAWPEVKKGLNGINFIDATYSANPTGVMADLDLLKDLAGKKVIVMPCLIELGKASKAVHERIGQKINEICDLAIITTKDQFKEIKKGAPKVLFIEKPDKIVEKIKSFCQAGDTVLLESRVPKQTIKQLL